MNRTDVINKIAERSGLTKSQADQAFMVFQDILLEAVKNDEKVNITGFFSVSRVERAARTGRNPRTGETIEIPASYGVKITPGSTLKKAARDA